jgi:anti-anti-sigma factor
MAPDDNIAVTVTERNGKPLLVLKGAVDIRAVQEFARAVCDLSQRAEDVSVCCEQVEHFDAAALQLLLALKKALALKGKKIEIVAKSPHVERLFEWAALN